MTIKTRISKKSISKRVPLLLRSLLSTFSVSLLLLQLGSGSYQFIALSALASPHIINGKTPEDTDESSCSESELMDYVVKAKKVISDKWQPIKGFEDRSAVAIFTVTQQGNIEEAKIVESSGSQAVDDSALAALKAASPLPPLPKGAPESIQIRYVFAWHVTHNYNR